MRQAQRERAALVWLENFAQDLRYGVRTLRRAPGFTVTAIATVGLGIGACTAIFSLVNAVLIRSLPYGDPERLVYLFTPNPLLKIPAEVHLSGVRGLLRHAAGEPLVRGDEQLRAGDVQAG